MTNKKQDLKKIGSRKTTYPCNMIQLSMLEKKRYRKCFTNGKRRSFCALSQNHGCSFFFCDHEEVKDSGVTMGIKTHLG